MSHGDHEDGSIRNLLRVMARNQKIIYENQFLTLKTLNRILRILQSDRQAVRFNYSVTILDKPRKDAPMPLDINLTNEQKVKITVSPTTQKGKAVTLDGPITATSSDPDTVVNVLDASTLEIISPDDVVGDRTIVISGDADPGSGVVTIEDVVTIHVGNPMAVSLGLAAGTPEPK